MRLSARSHTPTHRMQWWMRPGPSRSCASRNPPPRGPSRLPSGTRTPWNRSSECENHPSDSSPMTGSLRTCSRPSASVGTRTIDARAYGLSASGSVTTMAMAQAAPSNPVVNHLCPSRTHSPSSSRAVELMTVGFEPACSGSVIAKHDRTSPARSGSRNSAFWAAVACPSRSSMLPMSGACPFVAMWPSGLHPSASDTRPNAGSDSPAPPSSAASARFHRPEARASARASASPAHSAG